MAAYLRELLQYAEMGRTVLAAAIEEPVPTMAEWLSGFSSCLRMRKSVVECPQSEGVPCNSLSVVHRQSETALGYYGA